MDRRSWKDISTGQKTAVKVAAIAHYALMAAALIDLKFRDPERVRGSKKLWAAASTVNFVGPIAYFVRGRNGGST